MTLLEALDIVYGKCLDSAISMEGTEVIYDDDAKEQAKVDEATSIVYELMYIFSFNKELHDLVEVLTTRKSSEG